MMYQQAQGDLLIEKVQSLPAKKEPLTRDAKGRYVLATSEVKGESHVIVDPGVIAWQFEVEGLRHLGFEVPKASERHPVLILGGTDQAQEAVRALGLTAQGYRDRFDRIVRGEEARFDGEGHCPAVIIEPGLYHIPLQREYDPWTGHRQVAD